MRRISPILQFDERRKCRLFRNGFLCSILRRGGPKNGQLAFGRDYSTRYGVTIPDNARLGIHEKCSQANQNVVRLNRGSRGHVSRDGRSNPKSGFKLARAQQILEQPRQNLNKHKGIHNEKVNLELGTSMHCYENVDAFQ